MTSHHEHLTPFAHAAHNRCFGCGQANRTGLHLEFLLADDGSVVATPVVGGGFDGHPGNLHGGIIATLLDEAMSKAVRALGRTSVTRKLDVEYLRPVPSGVPIRIEGQVLHSDRRKLFTQARILDADGKLLAHAKGLFIEVDPKAEKGSETALKRQAR